MRAKLMFSGVVAALLFVFGFALGERIGDPSESVARFETQLESAFQPQSIPTPAGLQGKLRNIIQTAPAWAEVEQLATHLTWSNRQLAEAKALLRYESRPDAVYSSQWDGRFVTAQREWQVEEVTAFQTRRAGVAVAAGAVGFAASLGVLLGLSWMWGALLRRVRELSNAFRGTE